MESSNSNSKERELQLTQRLAKQRHSNCMTWVEQLETHLYDLYLLNSPYAVEESCVTGPTNGRRADDVCTFMIKLYSEYEYEIRYHPGKENVVTDALSRKERVKPRRVRMILAAQSEAFKQENIGKSSLTGPELVLDMTDKVVLIKEKLKAGKLALRYVGPFKILERVGPVAYRLRLPKELSGIKVDKTLRFVEEPVEIMDREVKRLKCSRMVVVRVHLGSKRGKVVSSKISCEILGGDRLLMILCGFGTKSLKFGISFLSMTISGATSYAFSDSLLLTPLCCDDIHDVTPCVSALAGCDRLVDIVESVKLAVIVIVGMDWLSKRKFVIVCHEKMELKLSDISVTPVAKSPYRLVPSKMQEWSEQLQELQEEVLELPRKEKLYAKFTKSEVVKKWEVPTTPSEMVIIFGLDRERVKHRRVRAMAMTIQYGVRGMILAAQSEAFKEENGMMRTVVMDEAHASRSPILWAEIEESSLIGPELVQETTDKVFEVGDQVMLKVSPWKGVIHFGKKVKLAPSGVHDTFHVLNLKKCWADASLHVRMDEIKVDKTLRFVEEPAEITDYEVKRLKRSRISLVKVYWNSKRGPEFTWEREDHMKSKYPQLFVDRAVESTS
ncbi:hypothetical protein Tco_1056834 [Tanacetum coccineum]|uniref:Tf2-1-like SH3-like domain-containing protein n=1 Tax=Tanacetum coccineum TaxID=301880 RepID=A0ABQ5H5K2_9ASTR